MSIRLHSGLAWLVVATFCGLIGFMIIYHYATLERPMQKFAIVVDAGSTQTRSSLYTISLDSVKLVESVETPKTVPLNRLLQVRQVSHCVNGGPLASVSSKAAARKLIDKCLVKFAKHIKRLDFIDEAAAAASKQSSSNSDNQPDQQDNEVDGGGGGQLADQDEISKQLALVDHRVNSVTHLHLGATAGMRALDKLDHLKASEKLRWIDEAIETSNSSLEVSEGGGGPFINRGFVGIISGAEEATFGWASVNFVCDTLLAPFVGRANESRRSIGTLELGGSSAQVAFEVDDQQMRKQISNKSQSALELEELNLFGQKHELATRSDLCLGMSQAVLRVNYILLRNYFKANFNNFPELDKLELENPCLQKGARVSLSGKQLVSSVWQGACLLPSNSDSGSAEFRAKVSQIEQEDRLTLIGSGNADKCNQVLNNLIKPKLCAQYFKLCIERENVQFAPQANMQFATISGYNHAVKVLQLNKSKRVSGTATDLAIEEKLGGASVEFDEFVNKTERFCSVDLARLLIDYPTVNKAYKQVICLQLVYIKKLLTEFYLFEPHTSWLQLKFVVFEPKSETVLEAPQLAAIQQTTTTTTHRKFDLQRDLGWTLGLLLNTTSEELVGLSEGKSTSIFFHHGASVMFLLRATIFLMFACCLIAIGLVVAGVYASRRKEVLAISRAGGSHAQDDGDQEANRRPASRMYATFQNSNSNVSRIYDEDSRY